MFHLSSLIIILIFGIMLNNYKLFFRGKLIGFINQNKISSFLDDMRVVTAETAFVVRTFFFIIFGWSVFLGSLLSFKVIGIGLSILLIIYAMRAITLFVFNGKDIILELFLAPRGLVTILLFFAIPEQLSIGKEFQGVLLFVVLISCFIMAWSLISYKSRVSKNKTIKTIEDSSFNSEIINNEEFEMDDKN
jgi:hypothetical protein